ncbi:putative surface protein with fasciclin (FAS1) repeats [Mucilaginibacter gracilis]|uniref:Beta-Ig-H3/fasciclin n=2 Tax=Mucilaginibacter TaxID=423349 RepID=H1YH29_9SPHI|nr:MULTISPECIES: fasciclin domain-containing protein [Mucilaginibacter]EHQ27438.1 beta-Ig-H3/fasciclin [Mucilaginibacter paludis DSM 18603]RKR81006.1 putative surface protein with fasciclin (FAS1) repeats [Mucilaginibacter gracilis]
MILKIRHFTYLLVLITLSCSCNKKWDNYNNLRDSALSQSLLERINRNPDLSQFYSLLVKTGYDKVIASSKSFTVWAPNNVAIQKVDLAIMQDSVRLKQFVGNHIANQSYLASTISGQLYIKTLNGKNVTFKRASVDDSPIIVADQYTGNGVLHVIGDAIIPKPSIWEYLMSTTTLQKQELISLNYLAFDRSSAIQTGVNPNTGAPIYKPGTGYTTLNRFNNLADISNEDSLYTYIVLIDPLFVAQQSSLFKYFVTTNLSKSDSLTKFNVISMLAFKGVLNSEAFPDTVYSAVDSVKFHLRKSDIVESRKVSNGIVYVMNNISYKLLGERNDSYARIKPITLQGENIDSMLVTKTYSVRTRRNPNNTIYQDMLLENHGTASMWVNYRTNANSVKYRVYWRVVRDNALALTGSATDLTYFPMRLAFNTPTNVSFTQAKPGVVDNGVDPVTGKHTFSPNYNDVLLGDFVSPFYFSKAAGFGSLNLFLLGNTVTTNGANTLLLDYIKLVPIP